MLCESCEYVKTYIPDAVETCHMARRIVLQPIDQHLGSAVCCLPSAVCYLHKIVSNLLVFLRDSEDPADAQWTRGACSGLPTIEAALRLLLRLAAPALGAGGGASAAPAHRLFILNAIPRLALGHSPQSLNPKP